MPTRIVFRRIAKREMDESIAWYENQRAHLGLEFAIEVDKTLEHVALNPNQFPLIRGEIRRALLRRFPYGLYYLIEENRVVIVAVFHFKRDPTLLEDR